MKLIRILIPVLMTAFLILPASASDTDLSPELYTAEEFDVDSIIDALPRDVADALPEGDIFNGDGFTERFSADYFFDMAKKALSESISPMLRTLSVTLGLVLVSSALSGVKSLFRGSSLSSLMEFISGLAIMLALYESAVGTVETVKIYLTQLCTIVNTMVPVMIAVGTAGGSISSATVSANAMMLGLSFVETLSAKGLFPILQVCFGLAIASGMSSGLRLGGISKLVRELFLGVLAFISAVISAVMTFQNSIAAHTDSLSMRAVRFAASKVVPVAGGIAGDAVSAVSGSLSLIKSTVGWVGVIIVIVLTVPVIARLIMMRLGMVISKTAADIIGMDRERDLISEMCGLFGFLIAVCVIAALMFVYALALFAKTASGI